MVRATGHDEGDHEMTDTMQTVDRDLLLKMFETITRIRTMDDKAQKLIGSAQAFFVHYPVRGHETISAAVSAVIEQRDYMTATYRGLADEVAKGVPLRELWGEMLGKATGTSKGRGGPMHISDPEHGLMLCTGHRRWRHPHCHRPGSGLAAPARRSA